MTSDGEALLTEWMLANLEVSWVAVDNPGPLERTVVGMLLPPLNDALATGSPFRPYMRRLREGAARGASDG